MTLSRPLLALLAAIFLASWLIPSLTRTLVRPDEGRYAEIAREMAVSGDFVTPRLNDLKYFEKPPLQYWATAIAFTLFGQSDLAARWWPAFTGLLALWLVASAAAAASRGRLPGIGPLAAVLLGSMCYFFVISHVNTLDMALTAFMTLTLVGLIRGFGIEGQSPATARRWMIAAWAGAALAFLSKGLIGIVLPGAIFVLYVLVTRQWRLLARLEWRWGPLVFALIALPWPLLVQSRNPEWAHFFFIYEHFERFASNEHNRLGSLHYFVPVLLAGVLPWTPALLLFARRDNRQALRNAYAAAEINVPLLLFIWCTFQFVFFSISQSKLPSYLVPVTPAIALLLAPVLLRAGRAGYLLVVAGMALVPVALAVLIARRDDYVSDVYTPGMIQGFAIAVAIALALYVAAITAAWWGERRLRRADGLIVAAVLATAAGSAIATGYGSLSASTSSQQLVADFLAVEPQYKADDPFFSVGLYEQTIPPYLKRPLTLVDYLDEMGLGAAAEPDKVRFNFEDFAEEWQATPRAYAVTDFDQLPRFDFAGLDYRVVAVDLRRVIVARHAP